MSALMQYWERPTDRDWASVLAEFPLFAGVGRRRLRRLARQAQVVEYAPGQVVTAPHEPGDLHVILSGTAWATGRRGTRMLRTGDYFGELAVLDGGPLPATVVATRELQVMKLPRSSFLRLAEHDPRISFAMLRHLGTLVGRLEPEPARR